MPAASERAGRLGQHQDQHAEDEAERDAQAREQRDQRPAGSGSAISHAPYILRHPTVDGRDHFRGLNIQQTHPIETASPQT